MKGLNILYKKMKRYCQKIFFKKFRSNIQKMRYLHKKMPASPSLLTVKYLFAYQMKGLNILYKKM